MVQRGILNPAINSLLCRVRHTNLLVIADRGFPFFPGIETIDITLVDGIPTVLDVLRAIKQNFVIGRAYMAEEFRTANSAAVVESLTAVLAPVEPGFEPHIQLKQRVPSAIGLIRTADTIPYANMILESA
jgi:D-ribose pyranase